MKLSHFCEQTQIVVARVAIGPETNVETELTQPFELEIAVPEVGMAARAMHD